MGETGDAGKRAVGVGGGKQFNLDQHESSEASKFAVIAQVGEHVEVHQAPSESR
jgi:hypothetical protein